MKIVFSTGAMKKIITCLFILFLYGWCSAQITSVKYSLKYNVVADVFDGYMIVEAGSATSVLQRIQFNAQYSLVVPTGTKFHISERYMPLQNNQNYAGTVPCEWKIVASIISPEAKPTSDFYAIVPTLAPVAHYDNLNQGDTIKLFSIKMDTIVGCASDIRLFENGSDPDASAPGMQTSDYSNGFTVGGITQLYSGNVIPTQSGFAGSNITMCVGNTEYLQLSPEAYGAWRLLGGNPVGSFLDSLSPIISSFRVSDSVTPRIYSLVYGNHYSYDLMCIEAVKPTVTISGDTVVWQGCSTELIADGGVEYIWSEGTPFNILNISNPGHYTVTVTDLLGCTATASLQITQNNQINLPGGNLCVGSPYLLPAIPSGHWISTNPSVATVNPSGVVSLIGQGKVKFKFVVNNSDCAPETGEFTVHPKPAVAIAGAEDICIGATTFLVPSTGGIWSSENNSVATVTASGLVTGLSSGEAKFIFTVTSLGCSSSPVTIRINPKPEVMITGPSTICAGGTTMLTPSSGGTWSSSNPGIATITNKGLVTALSAGAVTFIYTKTQTGCSSIPILITVSGHTMISIDKDTVEINKTIKLNHTGSGNWVSSNPNIVSIVNNSFAKGLALGTTTIYFIDTNTGCQSKDFSITVIDPVFKIIGYTFRDVNGNGIFDSQTDTPIPNCAIHIPVLNTTYYTDKTGYYRVSIEPGMYEVVFSVPFGHWASNSIQKNIIVDQSTEYLFAGFMPVAQENAVMVAVNGSFFDCNTLSDLDVTVFNNTSQKQSGYLSVEIDDHTVVTETLPFPVGSENNVLIWEYIDLLPGHTFTPKIKLDIPIPVTENDSLFFKAFAWKQAGDTLAQFDYGDKINCGITSSGILSWPDRPGLSNITYRNENLEYMIRFENNNIDEVTYAEVMCQLDKNIDISNIIIRESSHKIRSSLVDDKLFFYFDTLNLSGKRSAVSKSAYISFSCGFKKDVPDGTVISNTALVSLNGEPPYATNHTINTIVTKVPCYTKDIYAGICPGEVYVSGQEVFSEPGTYYVVTTDNTGCDSVSIIFLRQLSAPSDQITRTGNSLMADPTGRTFKWYECDSGELQLRSDEPEFSPSKNGRYYAVISGEDCDTKTDCYDFILSSSENQNLDNIALYPSPTTGTVHIQTAFDIKSITVQNIQGNRRYMEMKNKTLDVSHLQAGVYFLFIETTIGTVTKKLVKITE